MATALRWFVAVFGLVCIGIALMHIAIGPSSIPGSVPVNATMDSEDRFYATLFLGFGAALVWCSRDLAGRGREFLALQAVFFLGGVARLISWAQVGPPHPMFVILGAVELILPALLWVWLRRAYPAAI
jgi:amino acid permease